MYFRDLKEKISIPKELSISIIIFFVIAIICYGFPYGLLFICEWFSIISDAIIIVFTRDLIFRKKYTDETIKIRKLLLPVFLSFSIILHSITYYFLGSKGFDLILPMVAFLVTIYLIQRILSFINR
jgi:hypothetical protein